VRKKPTRRPKRAHHRKPPVDPAATLSAHRPPSFTTVFIAEPKLQFGGKQQAVDPKTGLGLFGPFDMTEPSRRQVVRLAIVGSGPLIDLTRSWIERSGSKIWPMRKKKRKDGRVILEPMDPRAFTAFPGVQEAFGAQFIAADTLVETLGLKELAPLLKIEPFESRVAHLVRVVTERLQVLADKPSPPDVAIVALPTDVRELVTIPSRHRRAAKERIKVSDPNAEKQGSLLQFLRDEVEKGEDESEPEHSVFHDSLKAYGMGPGIPTQLVWQGTLEGTVSVEDDATRAWNFWTGIYYKAGGVPWRVSGLPAGTCFVGVAFYRDKRDGTLRSCLAQAFSDQGEGLVLRSEPFKWEGSKSPHLPKDIAADLMKRVLNAYQAHLKQSPSRVVVHKWQRYWPDELIGFQDALSDVHSYDLLAFGSRGIRFFRAGQEPPLRGTVIQLAATNALLYTRGYVPFLGEYAGMRVPRPIEIVEHHGSASMTQLCQEIMALTKLDWNSAMFAGKEPITTAFSEEVGHILAELPKGVVPRPQYRFYM
jgi:hypothetical protein